MIWFSVHCGIWRMDLMVLGVFFQPLWFCETKALFFNITATAVSHRTDRISPTRKLWVSCTYWLFLFAPQFNICVWKCIVPGVQNLSMRRVLSLPWKSLCIISAPRALTNQLLHQGTVEILPLAPWFLCQKASSKGGHRSSNFFYSSRSLYKEQQVGITTPTWRCSLYNTLENKIFFEAWYTKDVLILNGVDFFPSC